MTKATPELLLCWLSSGGLDPLRLRLMLESCDDLFSLRDWILGGNLKEESLPPAVLRTLEENSGDRKMAQWNAALAQYDIHVLTCLEDAYPAKLMPYEDRPPILFYRGDIHVADATSVAMVGSRSASWKGTAATEKIAEGLSAAGIEIISGLAYGIDAAAHRGCLKGGSPTVAVMGCGLDVDYPQEHGRMKNEILEKGGVLISEYPPGEKPLGWHFPVRNRIISGLADCLIVMEARIRSGTMTTVQHALEQGKDVYVYPGDPDSPKSEGNRQLLREGGLYFTSVSDIQIDMQWVDKKREVRQNSGEISPWTDCSPEEKAVLSLLTGGELSFDQLCAGLNAQAAELLPRLTMMQLRGLIEPMPGKFYRIKSNHTGG